VSIDTLRADHVGVYGYERDTTPFLDRFAESATVFEHAFTPASWTLVAHMSMLTGLYPQQHQVLAVDKALSPEIPLLAERLRAAGYYTVGLYQPGLVHERHGFGRGFDVFRGHEHAEGAGRHLQEEMDRLEEGPFFVFVHLFDVHSSSFVEGQSIVYPSPEPFEDMFLPGAGERMPKVDGEDVWFGRTRLDESPIEALIALYDGGIRHVDTRIEQWLAELERRGLLEDTLVIVTADHGEGLGQRGRISGHGGYWNEGLHVPLIVRHPLGVRAGEREACVVSLQDIVPTVLDVLGLPPDPRLPGLSLFGPIPADRAIAGLRDPESHEYALRWPHKILHVMKRNNFVACDLALDPGEKDPTFAPEAAFREMLQQALGTHSYPPASDIAGPSEEDAEALRALGYGGDVEGDE
jgi:arylsulfatase A-like enzyme